MNAPTALAHLLPDALASDPLRCGWMQGSPPPADRQIRFADGSAYQFPQLRWTFSHCRELLPTRNVGRGCGPVSGLPRAERDDLDALRFTPLGGGASQRWDESLTANYTDGIVVLHHGRVVFERYFGALQADTPHLAMSLTKSVVGLLGALLIDEGTLDPNSTAAQHVPELAASGLDGGPDGRRGGGLGSATLRQLLDMRTGLKFSEDYANPQAEIWAHLLAGGVLPRPPGYPGPASFCEFMPLVQRQGAHGGNFNYQTVNCDALAWVMQRATGLGLADLLAQRLWSRLGAEQDAYLTLDACGHAFAGGGLNTCLRDLARLGEMLRCQGQFNGQQILPQAVLTDLQAGGSSAHFAAAGSGSLAGWSYRNFWWLSHNPHGAYMARGAHGQALYIDPAAAMVVARYATHPMASNEAIDLSTLPAFAALAERLISDPR